MRHSCVNCGLPGAMLCWECLRVALVAASVSEVVHLLFTALGHAPQ